MPDERFVPFFGKIIAEDDDSFTLKASAGTGTLRFRKSDCRKDASGKMEVRIGSRAEPIELPASCEIERQQQTQKKGISKMLESETAELKEYLSSLECVTATRKDSGPVQDVPAASDASDIGLRIVVPLPWVHDVKLPAQIMDAAEQWARERDLERFGMIVPANCPLLLIGLRKPAAP